MTRSHERVLWLFLCASMTVWAAPERRTTREEPPAAPLSVGASLGPAFSLNNGPFALRVGVRASYEWALIRKLSFRAGLGLGFQPSLGGNPSSLSFDLLPFGQMLVRILPELSAYAELGLGPSFGSTSATVFGTTVSSSYLGFAARIGAGVEYSVSPELSVGVEPVGVFIQNVSSSTQFGGQTITTTTAFSHYTLLLTATYRL